MVDYSYLSIEELVRRCSFLGELGAWEEFVRRFHRLIATIVLRTSARMGDPSKQTVDDLIQETYLRFCADNYRILRNFEHRHPNAFLGFVKVVAANVVRDHFKSSYSQKHGTNRIEEINEESFAMAGEGSDGNPRAIERAVLLGEIKHHLASCLSGPDQQRNSNIFWLYYRTGLTASAIAALPGVALSTKGVESLILRMTRDLRARMSSDAARFRAADQRRTEGVLPAESL